MGAHGATLVPDEARILTHCNAGALATAGYGTALGVIRAAAEQGKQIAVLADETRPFLQGARLTAWELVKDGIDTTVITDNMAGAMMRSRQVDLVVVGADRIAANGDVANKIGTYSVAVLAKEHGIPFYVAAPLSTIDLDTPDGSRDSRSRSATIARSRTSARAPDARGRAHPQPGVRRDAGEATSRRSSPSAASRAPLPSAAFAPFDAASRRSEGGERKQSCIGLIERSRPTVATRMIVLGIETSCDETAAALVEETGDAARPWRLRSSVVASQVDIHREWGGVVPGAVRAAAHPRHLRRRRARAPTEAGVAASMRSRSRRGRAWSARCSSACRSPRRSPGRARCRWSSRASPRRHIESLVLEHGEMPLPGRRARRLGRAHEPVSRAAPGPYELLGRTRDDAAGEAYDKVAKLLGSGIPAVPVIDRLAAQGNDRAIAFPKTRLTHADRNAPDLPGRRDFSFSGLKTSVLRHV